MTTLFKKKNKNLPRELLEKYPFLRKESVLIGYSGSVAYSTRVSDANSDTISDVDIMAVVVPTIDHYFGLKEFGSKGTEVYSPNDNCVWDIVIYEFKKFIKLLINNNPNGLSLLWLPRDKYIKVTEVGEELIRNKDLFISKKIYRSFTGYAHGQIKKMSRYTHYGYMGEKRKKSVEKYGYDTKNAAHAIRLLRMGIEFLNEGILYVDRSDIDASELLEIKAGEWSLEHIKRESDRLFERAEEAFIKCKLPEQVDYDKINKLCIKLIQTHFHNKIKI